MQDTLNKEASDDTTITAGFSVFGASFDSSTSFSKSEKMNKFQQEKETEQTVSFEGACRRTRHRRPYLPGRVQELQNL